MVWPRRTLVSRSPLPSPVLKNSLCLGAFQGSPGRERPDKMPFLSPPFLQPGYVCTEKVQKDPRHLPDGALRVQAAGKEESSGQGKAPLSRAAGASPHLRPADQLLFIHGHALHFHLLAGHIRGRLKPGLRLFPAQPFQDRTLADLLLV